MDIEQPEWLQQMEGILETLNEGVLIADDCTRIILANSNFLEMMGISREELIGKDATSYSSPEETEVIGGQRMQAIKEGHNHFAFVVPRNDGSRLPVIISFRAVEDHDDRHFGVITFTDMSDQKRAEKQLREANARLEGRQREIEEDLWLAARVQQSLAPKSLAWGGLTVEAYFHAVRTIGDDFGLVTPHGDDHLDLLVFDVSGYGVGSALIANRLYTETIAQLRAGVPLGEMLRHLNRFVMRNIRSSVFFFTVAAARIDRGGRRMVFAGAGHPPRMVVTPRQRPRLLESRSMVLGALPEAVDMEATLDVDLQSGDRVVLYTDGITDVFDSRGEILGVLGVEEIVRETAHLPFSQMNQGILDHIAAWSDGPPADDVPLVLVDVL